MNTCQCGDPQSLGMHWLEEDGNCCPEGCTCQDCEYWLPYIDKLSTVLNKEAK